MFEIDAKNHLVVVLKEIAESLPNNEMRAKLYETAEGLMSVAAASGVLVGTWESLNTLIEPNPKAKIETEKSTNNHKGWIDYLSQEAKKYREGKVSLKPGINPSIE